MPIISCQVATTLLSDTTTNKSLFEDSEGKVLHVGLVGGGSTSDNMQFVNQKHLC